MTMKYYVAIKQEL